MKLSVIIPNWNNEEYLEECLESVINQTFKPYEIIIADDCSTDNSINIIKSYEKKYDFVRGIYAEKNRGVCKNRHNAILQSRGDYFTTIDSDDKYINKEKLENEIKILKENEENKKLKVIAFSKTLLIDSNSKVIKEKKKFYYMEGDILFRLLCRYKPRFIPRDFCMRKEIYLEIGGYDFDFNLYEDLEYDIRIASKYKFICTKENGTGYRQHNSGLSSQKVEKHKEALKKIFNKNIDLLSGDKRLIAKLISKYKY